MEEMHIDQVVEIPDTPDRLAAQHINNVRTGKERTSSIATHLRKSEMTNEEPLNNQRASKSRLFCENVHNRKPHLQPTSNPIMVDEVFEHCNKSVRPSSSENSSEKAPLFRRAGSGKIVKPESRHSVGQHHLEKRKTEHVKVPFKMPAPRVKDNAFVGQNDHDKIFDLAFPHGASDDLRKKVVRGGPLQSNGGSSLQVFPVCSRTSDIALKGKEKIDANTSNGYKSAKNHGKGIVLSGDSLWKTETQMDMPHGCSISPRVAGKKRLVRNGCISPSNIADRARELAGKNQIGSSDIERDQTGKMVSSGPLEVDIAEVVAEDSKCTKAKGKRAIIHSYTSEDHDANISHVSSSNGEAAAGFGHPHKEASVGCWGSTHNRGKKIDQSLPVVERDSLETRDYRRCFLNEDHGNRMVNKSNVSGSQQCHVGNRHLKRRRTQESTSRNYGKHSVILLDDSELLGSSRVSSSSNPSVVQNHQGQKHLGLSIDELPSEMRNNNLQLSGSACNGDSDARARQVEEDEILARELQEQLYHETSIFGGDEIDENIAWALQQEEGAVPSASTQNRPSSRPRSSSMRSHGQPQLRSSQNSSNRRGTQVQVPSRAPRSRSRIINRPLSLSRFRSRAPAAISRGFNFPFPLGMDLDMRLNILEVLENELSGMEELENAFSGSHILQRDFNENDYEMLLALDENNRQAGASANQINNLPESVVRTENPEETCAVCLEMPKIGETIRHLPCLHKFHKDCIDPWLTRSTSCPVCKSSIT